MTQKMEFVFWWVENIVGKGENAGYQYYFLFPQCFQKAPYKELSKVCGEELCFLVYRS